MAGLSFALAGPGKVGASLTAWMTEAGASLSAVAGRPGSENAERLAACYDAPVRPLAEVGEGASLVLVAVADPALDRVAGEISEGALPEIALHTSGSRSGHALEPLADRGVSVGSLHPLRAFPEAQVAPGDGAGTVFGIDGLGTADLVAEEGASSHEPPALGLARRIAESVGGQAVEVPAESRLLYHFGATLAAGGVVTVMAVASALASDLGLPEGVRAGYLELAKGALEALGDGEPAAGVTGPAARGDQATVLAQLGAFAAAGGDEDVELAHRLAAATLRHIRRVRDLDPSQARLLEALAPEPSEAPQREPSTGDSAD